MTVLAFCLGQATDRNFSSFGFEGDRAIVSDPAL
jgi:hypothetical protein